MQPIISTSLPTIESLIGSHTVGERRTPRQRDIRSGRPCLSLDDHGDLIPLAKCPRRWHWLPSIAAFTDLKWIARTRSGAKRAIKKIMTWTWRLMTGVAFGFALMGATVVTIVGVSHLAHVRWGLIAAALQGDQPVSLEKVDHSKKVQSVAAPSAPTVRVVPPLSDTSVPPGSPTASQPVSTQSITTSAPQTTHPDLIPPPPIELPKLPLRAIAPVAAGLRSKGSSIDIADLPNSETGNQESKNGVHVSLMPAPDKSTQTQPNRSGSVTVKLLTASEPTPVSSHPLAAKNETPARTDWSVVTVIPGAVVLRRDGRMINVSVGSRLPDGRLLQSVNLSSGTWAAANSAPTASSSQPQQEQHHAKPSRARPNESQPAPPASAAR